MGWAQWLTLIILVPQREEIWEIPVADQPGQKVLETPSQPMAGCCGALPSAQLQT
jgi:hypothetical protein